MGLLITIFGLIYFMNFHFIKNGAFEKLFISSICALLVWTGATIDIKAKFNTFKPAFLILVGDASYSIYLSHAIVLSLSCKMISKISLGHTLMNFSFVIIFILAIALGILFHILIEKNTINVANKIFKINAESVIKQPIDK